MTTALWIIPGLIAGLGILAFAVVGIVEGLSWLGDRALARIEPSPSQKEPA